ncbi:MAG: LysR family transcriptional regulator [Herbinix sp.]|nr:LysR family transcriptional regulator [Herbinix sp.]
MTLKHMKIFKEVCIQEGITRAADQLNMAQPAVSLVIREMEEYYKIKLFERLNRRLYITDAGKVLLQYADTIIQQFEEAENAICSSKYISTLRIGVNISLGLSLLPAILEEFGKRHPKVITTSMINNSDYIEKKLIQNEIDLAIVDHRTASINFKEDFLLEDRMIVVCGKKYGERFGAEITLEQLAKEKLLLREKGSGLRSTVDAAFDLQGLVPNIVMESISTNALFQAAAHNLGIFIISEKSLKLSEYREELIKMTILDADLRRKYYAIYNQNKYVTPAMTNFIELAHVLLETMR